MVVKFAVTKDRPYSFLMLSLPDNVSRTVAAWVREFIPDNALAGDGKEPDLHVTLLPNIKTGSLEEIESFLPKSPIVIELGQISRFEQADYDVLKIEVHSDELMELNCKLQEEIPNAVDFEYTPHVTLAYIKNGALPDLDGDSEFSGIRVELAELVWSPRSEDMAEDQTDEDEEAVENTSKGKETSKLGWFHPIFYKE